MIRRLFLILSPALLALSAAFAAEPGLSIHTNRPDAQYRVGETVTFEINVSPAIKAKAVSCILSKDGWNPQPAQEVEVIGGKAKVTGTLNEPGFLLLRASLPDMKTIAMAAAAFDPLQIPPSQPVPEDFDAFWLEQKKALAQAPMKAQLTKVPSPVDTAEAFDVKVTCLGMPVSGYLGYPREAKPKSLPAILFVHGAGVRSSNLGSVSWTQRAGGMLTLDINAHGLENGRPASYYTEQANTTLKDYRQRGRDSRDDIYFRGMFLRLVRAIDFLTSRPEWDGRTLIVYGSSQGGFQALAATGLDERVTFVCAGVPAGCDHSGATADRISGWPKLVTLNEGKPSAAELAAARYYDAVNFATRARAKGAAVTVGFIDTTCPPTSVYAAYNALPIEKVMHTDVLSGHTNTPAASQFMQDAALAHVREMQQR